MKKVLFHTCLLLFAITGWTQDNGRLPVYQPSNVSGDLQPIPNVLRPQAPMQRKSAGNLLGRTSFTALTTGTDVLVNNNAGANTTGNFTQSETSIVANGNNIVIGFNDAGSFTPVIDKFTGFSISSNGGATFTDGGTLPSGAAGDAGDPVLALNQTTGRIYFATLGFNSPGLIQVFRSDNNGLTWLPPVTGTPGGSSEDKAWMTVDNFSGPGNGNVYVMSRRFGTGPGMYFFKSTDNGNTFGPTGGLSLASGFTPVQGAYVAVGPDHSVYAFMLVNNNTIQVRKSIDLGVTFGAPITVATGLGPATNGDQGLTGLRQGTATFANFRSNEFPHVAVNPVTGQIYVVYPNKVGSDKGNIYMVRSPDGLSWSPPEIINDDGTLTDQWLPNVSVTPDGLNLGIFYYSRQEDVLNNNLFRFYGRIGTIAGGIVTFSPSFPISDVPSLPEFGRDNVVNSVYMGDYDVSVGTLNGFHVVWSDNRDDLPGGGGRKDPNVYYDFVGISEPVDPNVFYSKPLGDLHVLATWGNNPDGSGPSPSDFGFGKTFNLANRGGIYMMTAGWNVEGQLVNPAGSQLVINGFVLSIAGMTGGGTLTGSPTSTLRITGTVGGEAGPLMFTPGGQELNSLMITRPGGTATFLNSFEIYNLLNVMNGILTFGAPVTLNSDAVNTARVMTILPGNFIFGNVIVERYIPARRAWRIMSAPIQPTGQTIFQAWQENTNNTLPDPNPFPGFGTHITGGPVFGSPANGFDQNPGAATSIKFYNSAVDNWVAQPNTNATPVGDKAYMLFIRGDRGIPLSTNNVPPTPTTLRAMGPLKIGDQTFTVNPTGFTAIGNPFASPVDFATITKTNVQNSMYLWDPKMGGANGVGAYVNVSFNGSGYDVTPAPTSPESQFIQNGQGFLVKTISSATPGTLIIKETDKSLTPNMDVFRVARNSSSFRINLNVVNEDHSVERIDEVFSSYSTAFSDKVNEMDADKLPNINENLAIVHEGKMLMVERRSGLKNEDAIALKVWNLTQRNYELHFVPDHLQGSVQAWLVDNYLKTVTPIKSDGMTTYTFSVTGDVSSERSDRFKVVISDKRPSVIDVHFTVKAYPNPLEGKILKLELNNADNGNYSVRLVNSLGQVVFEKNISYTGNSVIQNIELDKNISKGIYQVSVRNGSHTASVQLVVGQPKQF